MKWLSAGLTFVNISTIAGLLLGIMAGGLNPLISISSLILGAVAAIVAYLRTSDPAVRSDVSVSSATTSQLSRRAQRRLQKTAPDLSTPPTRRYNRLWFWGMAACFTIFAVRSFCWLLYIEGDELRIQSPNNLGDLALHITYIKNFANGVPLWPDNPIYVLSHLRYPAGIDLFNALLSLRQIDLMRGLVWTGLLASAATFYAFYRWGGTFGIAGFLFNGGIAGFQFLNTFKFLDYEGDKAIAWKSIPLSMFVTQRGLLYAIPAGLILLWHWREKYFRNSAQDRRRGPLPFWVELSLYASMPLFHVHTFLALSIVLFFLFVFGDPEMRGHLVTLVGSAVVPATFFVWLVTDHFGAGSVLAWHPGWVQDSVDFAAPFFRIGPANLGGTIPILGWLVQKTWNGLIAPIFQFWLTNFGVFVPLVLAMLVLCGHRVWKSAWRWPQKLPEDAAFLLPATAIFILALFMKTAPWEWDNLKIMIWAYFLVLPFLWTQLIARWPLPVRIAVCIVLFGSGFVSLLGGLAAPGFGFATRSELDGVGAAVRDLPVEARFAAFPTYNHPLLLQGRKLVLGYPGHLWTQGFDNYGVVENKLRQLMNGAQNWHEIARDLGVRYIFWGREEKINYPTSARPWEKSIPAIVSDNWGAIYDLEPLESKAAGAPSSKPAAKFEK